jgi:hypothetical protein
MQLQGVNCTLSVPPKMNPPIAAFDDRNSHLTVSWQGFGNTFGSIQYILEVCFFFSSLTKNFFKTAIYSHSRSRSSQMSVDNSEMEVVFEGDKNMWDTNEFSKHSDYDFHVRAINCATPFAEWSDSLHIDGVPSEL